MPSLVTSFPAGVWWLLTVPVCCLTWNSKGGMGLMGARLVFYQRASVDKDVLSLSEPGHFIMVRYLVMYIEMYAA